MVGLISKVNLSACRFIGISAQVKQLKFGSSSCFQTSQTKLLESCSRLPVVQLSIKQFSTDSPTSKEIMENEPEKLFSSVDILMKGHENSVLSSYVKACTLTAQCLNITIFDTVTPKAIYDRLTFLKSANNHRRHKVQYEMRTYKRVVQLKFLTESTANTYLEYIQRNIPAGVAMEVHKREVQRIPSKIREQMANNITKLSNTDWERESSYMEKRYISKDMTKGDFEEYLTTKPYLVGTT